MTEIDKLFRINLASPEESFMKQEVIKLLLVMYLLRKFKKQRHGIRIYTEFNIIDKRKADVYFENILNKEVIIFEIQKDYSLDWTKKLQEDYKDLEIAYINEIEIIPLKLREFPDDIKGINKKLEDYI